jgi:hypothetical protein
MLLLPALFLPMRIVSGPLRPPRGPDGHLGGLVLDPLTGPGLLGQQLAAS